MVPIQVPIIYETEVWTLNIRNNINRDVLNFGPRVNPAPVNFLAGYAVQPVHANHR